PPARRRAPRPGGGRNRAGTSRGPRGRGSCPSVAAPTLESAQERGISDVSPGAHRRVGAWTAGRREATPRHPRPGDAHGTRAQAHPRLDGGMSELLDAVEIETGLVPQAAIIWLHGLGADGHDFEP